MVCTMKNPRRLGPGLVLAVLVGLLGACSPASFTPLGPAPADASLDTAVKQSDRLALLVEQLELRYSVAAPPGPDVWLAPGLPARDVSAALSDHVFLSGRSRTYLEAHATYLTSEWGGATRPTGVTVTASDVSVVGTDVRGDAVAGATIAVTYAFDDAPDRTRETRYAVTWSEGTGPVDADGNSVSGEHLDDTRLVGIEMLHESDGQPALDAGEGSRSPRGAVLDYAHALRSGTDRAIDALEGGVHTSDEIREELRETLLAAPRYSTVEMPTDPYDDEHVVYLLDEGPGPVVGFDVTFDDDGPVVAPRL